MKREKHYVTRSIILELSDHVSYKKRVSHVFFSICFPSSDKMTKIPILCLFPEMHEKD